jgi:hypothetical protein
MIMKKLILTLMAFFAFGYMSAQTDTTATRQKQPAKSSTTKQQTETTQNPVKRDSLAKAKKRRLLQDKGMHEDSTAVPPRKRNR